MVAVAELEAGLISARTKTALAPAKRRGVKLGGNRGVRPFPSRSKASRRHRCNLRSMTIGDIRAGCRGLPLARGNDQ
jgi:DNA invertase Pin-like site-specific DNA recombinase